jgi:hypothetical protein
LVWTIGTVGLEITARGLGQYDVVRGRPQHVWDISATTKRHIAEGANAQTQQNVLVFHIVNFHRQQLELGARASRQLMQRLSDQIKRTLGSDATVSIQRSGTIVALLHGDRAAAERTARELVQRFEASPPSVDGHGAGATVTLACGIVAFPQAGPPSASSIPVSLPDPRPVAPLPA